MSSSAAGARAGANAEDTGQIAAFLASDATRNIIVQSIAVDGGITLRQSR